MSYRNILIQRAERLSLFKNNLKIERDDEEIFVSLEDIAIILLEDVRTVITTPLLGAMGENNIVLICCNSKFIPISITMSLNNHYKQLGTFKLQLEQKKPLFSQIWKEIIIYKIINQDLVLQKFDKYSILDKYYNDVHSDDRTNREAVAAKEYFKSLFGNTFTRKRGLEDLNCALDYGYSILLAQTIRYLSLYGFNTCLGVHHCSMVNNFNLACDLMEPFRPLVDIYVYENRNRITFPLSSDIRVELVQILDGTINVNNMSYRVKFAIEEVVKSYLNCLMESNSELIRLPTILL